MYYNDFQDIRLSGLGMGCMRLPVIDGDDAKPDAAAVQEMVDYAMANGINYYDTAWGYHGGNSETVLGQALSKYDHKDFYIASKFPGYDLSNFDHIEEIFEKQLEKCKVDYFDFYLFHNVCEMNIDKYLDDAYLSHLTSVRVVHGKGTGALRSAVQNHLKRLKCVKEYRLGEYGEGDAGVTIVTFK